MYETTKTSAVSSHRLTQIDELHLAEFPYLRADDDCYFLGEYTVRKGYDFSPTNDLVINLKKGICLCAL